MGLLVRILFPAGLISGENPPSVSVAGDVRNPGTYTTPGQIRLADAVGLAGGLSPGSRQKPETRRSSATSLDGQFKNLQRVTHKAWSHGEWRAIRWRTFSSSRATAC